MRTFIALALMALALGASAAMSSVPGSVEALPEAGLPPPPDLKNLPSGEKGKEIAYGLDLLANTAKWLGPEGRVKSYTKSRMACRNCHLDSGMRPLGNSWLDTFQLYPQYRAREGGVQTLPDRINACLQHPLQGQPLPVDGKEMMAMVAYYQWIGRSRPVLWADPDNRLVKLKFLDRAADPQAGNEIFGARCAKCHGANGEGKLSADQKSFIFPPLWGSESFMTGSSMSRVSSLARFIRGNMPLGATAAQPLVTEEQAWDLAAFVDSKERPQWKEKTAFPNAKEKPFDFPIGPYGDSFPVAQHLYGPYQPIIDYWRSHGEPVVADPTGI